MNEFIMCSIPLMDMNDTIVAINELAVNMDAASLVSKNPAQFWIEKTSLGDDRLCTIRKDGQPMLIEIINNQNTYYAYPENFEPSYAIARPMHTPGAPRPK